MIIRRETYFVILIITVSSFADFHCPTNRICGCEMNYEGAFEINCLMENDSSFLVNIQPNQYIQVHVSILSYIYLDTAAKIYLYSLCY